MISKRFFTVFLSVGMIFTLTGCQPTQPAQPTSQSTGQTVIKAGYISYAPGFIVDPNTKKMSGIFYEVLEEIAVRKNLKIQYTEEVTRATLVEVLDTKRVDIIASPVWMTAPRVEKAEFSVPVYYSPIGTYVRANEQRIKTLDDINNPTIKIAAVDGEGGQTIAQTMFPKATLISFPNSIDVSQMLLEVAAGKEDVTFAEPIFAYEYIKNNPGKLKNIAETNPVEKRVNAFMMRKDDTKLRYLINEGITELISDGTLDKIIDKYEPFPNAIVRMK